MTAMDFRKKYHVITYCYYVKNSCANIVALLIITCFLESLVSPAFAATDWEQFDDTGTDITPVPEWEDFNLQTPSVTPTKPAAKTPKTEPKNSQQTSTATPQKKTPPPTATISQTPVPKTPQKKQSPVKHTPTKYSALKTKARLLNPHVTMNQTVMNNQDAVTQTKTWISLSTGVALSTHVSAVVAGNFEYHGYWDDATEYLFESYLQEASIRYMQKGWYVSGGQQSLGWGGADILSPFRDVTPIDMRYQSLVLDESAWKTRSRFLCEAGYRQEHFNSSIAYSPFFVANKYSLFSSDWITVSNAPKEIDLRFSSVQSPGEPFTAYESFNEFLAKGKGASDGGILPATTQNPDDFTNGHFLARVLFNYQPFELSLIYINGWDRYPTAHFSTQILNVLSDLVVTSDESEAFIAGLRSSHLIYHRHQVVGFTSKYMSDLLIAKFDGVYSDGETVYANLFEPHRSRAGEICIGADVFPVSNFFLNAGISISYLESIPEGSWRKTTETAVYGRVHYMVLPSFYPYAGFLVDLRSAASLIDAGFSFQFLERLTARLGAHIQNGKESYLYELRPFTDELYMSLELTF